MNVFEPESDEDVKTRKRGAKSKKTKISKFFEVEADEGNDSDDGHRDKS